MSGPIVRKYGFPNFEKIFGERALQHGTDESESAEADQPEPKAMKKASKKSASGQQPRQPSKRKK